MKSQLIFRYVLIALVIVLIVVGVWEYLKGSDKLEQWTNKGTFGSKFTVNDKSLQNENDVVVFQKGNDLKFIEAVMGYHLAEFVDNEGRMQVGGPTAPVYKNLKLKIKNPQGETDFSKITEFYMENSNKDGFLVWKKGY